jgi:hypothetical protein
MSSGESSAEDECPEAGWFSGEVVLVKPFRKAGKRDGTANQPLDAVSLERLRTNHAASDAHDEHDDWLERASTAVCERAGEPLTYRDLIVGAEYNDEILMEDLTKEDRNTLRKLDALPAKANPILDNRRHGNYRFTARTYAREQKKKKKATRKARPKAPREDAPNSAERPSRRTRRSSAPAAQAGASNTTGAATGTATARAAATLTAPSSTAAVGTQTDAWALGGAGAPVSPAEVDPDCAALAAAPFAQPKRTKEEPEIPCGSYRVRACSPATVRLAKPSPVLRSC